jgi:hypothetical protein
MTDIKAKGLKYKAGQEHILRRMGAALIIHWDDLPDALQDTVIDQAAAATESRRRGELHSLGASDLIWPRRCVRRSTANPRRRRRDRPCGCIAVSSAARP